MRERWRNIAAVVGPWTLFGLYSGAETHYRSSFSHKPYSWGSALLAETAYTLLWAALTPAIVRLARRFRIERGRAWPSIGIHATASVAGSLLTKTIWDLIFERSGPWALAPFTWTKYFLSMSMVFTEGIALYWLVILLTSAYDYYRQYQSSLIRASSLQTQLVQAQLQALKMQLQPHFLFNALHSISALIHEDAEAADRMIARLSEMLRLSLETGGVQQVPLHQELRYLNLYLDIEKTRFEERLQVCFDIEPCASDALVPNLVFQPLVENSIRHGLAPRVRGGCIHIEARRDGRNLLLRVTDDGQGLPEGGTKAARQGIGLGATRGRLERLYGEEQSLLLRNMKSGGAEVLITIPFATNMRNADEQNKSPDSG